MIFRTRSRVISLLVAIAASLIASVAQSAPILDNTFGLQGVTRIGAPWGFEDTTTTSAMLADGRIVIGGMAAGRQNHAFVARFTTSGLPDTSFAAGTLLLPPPPTYVWMSPVQLEPMADGGLLVVSTLHDGFVLTRLTPQGQLDPAFGTGGSVVVQDAAVNKGSQDTAAIKVAIQPDGRLLVVTDASGTGPGSGTFALRVRGFSPTGFQEQSLVDPLITNLPPHFMFSSSRLAVVEPNGGITLVARATISDGTYLMLRITPQRTLDTTFGGVGYRSGYDIGNPADAPYALARLTDGSYALVGSGLITNPGPPSTQDWLWKVDANGTRSNFGNNGRVGLGATGAEQRAVTALPDGAIAVAQSVQQQLPTQQAAIRIWVFESSGAPRATFGGGGTTGNVVVPVAGYIGAYPVGVHGDSAGRITAAGWANMRTVISGVMAFPRGSDAFLASVTPTGAPRTDYGRRDGTAILNNPAFSNDRVDTLLIDTQGRIAVAGFTDVGGTFDYLLSRLNPNGSLDQSFATDGRLTPGIAARFVGPARAALQPNGAIVVATGEAGGSFGSVRSATMFRVSTNGALDGNYRPAIAAAGPNAAVGLVVRPDGRVVYVTNDFAATAPGTASYVLQQFLPDGTPDPAFGTNGRALLPAFEFSNAFSGDAALLNDGSLVFAAVTGSAIRIYKVDARGTPVATFGANGSQQVVPGSSGYNTGTIRVLALADGTLLVAAAAFDNTGPSLTRSVQLVRLSASGAILATPSLKMDPGQIAMGVVALPDASVIIARAVAPSVSTLARLLPDNQFDQAFGGATGTPVTFTSVTALGVDANGALLVAGQDATSALVARYRLDAPAASVAAVEYFNVNLRHYFVTANAAEQRSVETGGAGPGWQRTGNDFRLWVAESGVPIGAVPVCRFYGTPGRGPNSHFYTANAAECAAVKRDPGWTYEGIAFYVLPPANDACDAGSAAVFRAYNNGFVNNDSNHRYSTQRPLLQAMTTSGWSVEGVAFCAAGN